MALRVGAEEKKKVYVAAGLGLVVLVLLGHFLWQTFGSSTPAPPPPPVIRTVSPQTPPSADQASPGPEAQGPQQQENPQQNYAHPALKVQSSSLDPTLHPELMRQAESLEYTGNGRNIFSPFSAPPAIPKAIASVRRSPVDAGPPPPPPPPPIDLRFYGYASEKNGHKQVFLLKGFDIFIASEGDVVDRRYRVTKIGATSVQIEDLPYHDTQTLQMQ
jgi:hypothetical protein